MGIFVYYLIGFFTVSTQALAAFVHPGLLHKASDFKGILAKVDVKAEPWYAGWQLLTSNKHAQTTYVATPDKIVRRGVDSSGTPENYPHLYNNVAAVYQFANAVEILRDYSGWTSSDQSKTGKMFATIFVTTKEDFLINHNGAGNAHYYANWDMCNIASLMAIGIFNDNATAFNFAVDYYLHDPGLGALRQYIFHNFTEAGSSKTLAQGQESGRDQGHAILDLVLTGVIAQHAYNQGVDLFAAYTNALLTSAEYASKYNSGNYVP